MYRWIEAAIICSTVAEDSTSFEHCLKRLSWGGLRVTCLRSSFAASSTLPPDATLLPDSSGAFAQPISDWLGGLPASASVAVVTQHTPAAATTALQQAGVALWFVGTNTPPTFPAPDIHAGVNMYHSSQGAPSPCQHIQSQPCHAVTLPSISQLPWHIAQAQARRAPPTKPVLIVAYAMKASREKDMSLCTPSNTVSTTITTTTTTTSVKEYNTPAHSVSGSTVVREQGAPRCAQQGSDNINDTSATATAPTPITASGCYTGGLLALVPQQGLVFAPLDLDAHLDDQMPFHVLLHKGSDELQYTPDGAAPQFSPRLVRLQQWLGAHPHIRVVDPFECTAKVINRLELCKLTEQLVTCPTPTPTRPGGRPVRVCAPRYCILDAADEFSLDAAIERAGVHAPWILKPCVACGLPDSHRMALVLARSSLGEALRASGVRLPAVLQEARNHGGKVAKVYAAGHHVFHSIRPSLPDLPAWSHMGPQAHASPKAQAQSSGSGSGPQESIQHHTSCQQASVQGVQGDQQQPLTSAEGGPDTQPHIPPAASGGAGWGGVSGVWLQARQQGFLAFDSLKSLPTQVTHEDPNTGNNQSHIYISACADTDIRHLLEAHPEVLDAIAAQLQGTLGLSLFGFDVVAVSQCSGGPLELQVIDVNYFPSFKVPGAAGYVWAAIKEKRG